MKRNEQLMRRLVDEALKSKTRTLHPATFTRIAIEMGLDASAGLWLRGHCFDVFDIVFLSNMGELPIEDGIERLRRVLHDKLEDEELRFGFKLKPEVEAPAASGTWHGGHAYITDIGVIVHALQNADGFLFVDYFGNSVAWFKQLTGKEIRRMTSQRDDGMHWRRA